MQATSKSLPQDANYSQKFAQASENYHQSMSDDKSRNQLIEDYLPLVKSIVSRLRYHFPDTYETDDMYSIGVRSLILAVNRFDPSKGKAFGNYAALRIKGGLLDELRKIDHLPRANRAKAKSLQSTILELEAHLKRPPTPEEICKELNLSIGEYNKLLQQTQPITFVPLDSGPQSQYFDGESQSLTETLHDPTELTPFDHAESSERVEMLRDHIKELPVQNQKILMLYYIEELRLSEIAQVFSLSEGRISQIISHSIISLRAKFQTTESS